MDSINTVKWPGRSICVLLVAFYIFLVLIASAGFGITNWIKWFFFKAAAETSQTYVGGAVVISSIDDEF